MNKQERHDKEKKVKGKYEEMEEEKPENGEIANGEEKRRKV